jgi:hypothetical protein
LLRSIEGGQLRVIRTSDWTLSSSLVILGPTVTAGAVVHR